MGGRVGVESLVGEGSVFWFEVALKLAADESAAATQEAAPGEDRDLSANVLLVEDDAVNQLVVQEMLRTLGCAVDLARDGDEARAAAASGRYDLILMDLHMPVMDGAEAAQAIRALAGPEGRVPIVALTADVFPETRARCLAAGMNDFLSKPVGVHELGALFARMFGMRGSHAMAAPSAAPADDELFDRGVLVGVRALMSHERFMSLLSTFFADAGERSARMHEALRRGAVEDARQAAHGARGAALNLGLKALAEAAQQIHHGAPALVEHVQRFDELLARTREACAREGWLAVAAA
jgi:CheY-like chemotaxis protein